MYERSFDSQTNYKWRKVLQTQCVSDCVRKLTVEEPDALFAAVRAIIHQNKIKKPRVYVGLLISQCGINTGDY